MTFSPSHRRRRLELAFEDLGDCGCTTFAKKIFIPTARIHKIKTLALRFPEMRHHLRT